MKFIKLSLLLYCLLLAIFLFLSSTLHIKLLFLPVVLYLLFATISKFHRDTFLTRLFNNRLFLYYSFIISTILVIGGFIGARSTMELILPLIFTPLVIYLGKQVLPSRRYSLKIEAPSPTLHLRRHQPGTRLAVSPVVKTSLQKGFDNDRRMFIKLIGSAGLSLFLFSLFTKKAHAAFFGSVPGPGTVAIKDSGGTQIDPAIKHPTDGYEISEIDDATPAYYGFINKDGAWFIMKEESSGAYRYFKAASNFSTNWTNRASLAYDYFHNIF